MVTTMENQTLIYQITELPDPNYSRYLLQTGGEVREAVKHDCEQILRVFRICRRIRYPPLSDTILIPALARKTCKNGCEFT